MVGGVVEEKGDLGAVASEEQLLDEPDEIFGVIGPILNHGKTQALIGADSCAYRRVLGLFVRRLSP